MPNFKVRFLPDDKEVIVDAKSNLLAAAAKAGISIKGTCGGNGSCGQCKIRIKEGRFSSAQKGKLSNKDISEGYTLACQSFPETDLLVEIPESSRLTEHQVLLDEASKSDKVLSEQSMEGIDYGFEPLFKRIQIELSEPTLEDSSDDLNRLITALRKKTGIENLRADLNVVRELPEVLRKGNWKIKAGLTHCRGFTEITTITAGWDEDRYYGLAVDIGTTTVVVDLVDLANGKSLGSKGTYNKQAVYGDDVISRIIYSDKHGQEELQKAVINTINHLIAELKKEHAIEARDIWSVVCAGNTTMTHLFLGIDPTYIRLEPYTPAANNYPLVRAQELGLDVNPRAWVHCLPGISSYVGGDITSGVLVTGMTELDDLTLFIDVGTNGEMVLGNKEWLISCSCSAGPAFEGSGIEHGMRAMRGAIERVKVLPGGFGVEYRTVGRAKPVGICGSGLIDCMASLYEAGVIDRTGKFVEELTSPRARANDEGKEFVLVWAEESGKGEDITISEADIKTLIRSKAAVFAGIRSMLDMVGVEMDVINRVLIAGGFGRHINVHDAVRIGLLPDFDASKYVYIGNSSVKGARAVLCSRKARDEADEIVKRMTYLELSAGNLFMDEFMKAMFLPHTDLSLFPSLQQESDN